jgi:hypothetical protein
VSQVPAHPHEGAVQAPPNEPRVRAVARGKSLVTGREVDLVVAFGRTGNTSARAIAESSSHHFADYNWDIERGAPSFVTETAGDQIRRQPDLLNHVGAYVRSVVAWLAPGDQQEPDLGEPSPTESRSAPIVPDSGEPRRRTPRRPRRRPPGRVGEAGVPVPPMTTGTPIFTTGLLERQRLRPCGRPGGSASSS